REPFDEEPAGALLRGLGGLSVGDDLNAPRLTIRRSLNSVGVLVWVVAGDVRVDGVIRVLPFADNLPACLFQQLGGGGGGASGGVVGGHRDTGVGLVDDLAEAVDGSFLVIAVAVSGHLPLENGYNAVVAHHDVCRGGDGGNVAVRVGSRAPIGVDLVELGHDLAQINLGDNGGDVQPAVRGDRVPCPLGRVKLGRSEKLAAGQDDTGRECVVNGVPVLLNDVLQNAVF